MMLKNNETSNDISDRRAPYETPELRTIELITDEVLSGNCKVEGVTSCDDPFSGQAYAFGS